MFGPSPETKCLSASEPCVLPTDGREAVDGLAVTGTIVVALNDFDWRSLERGGGLAIIAIAKCFVALTQENTPLEIIVVTMLVSFRPRRAKIPSICVIAAVATEIFTHFLMRFSMTRSCFVDSFDVFNLPAAFLDFFK